MLSNPTTVCQHKKKVASDGLNNEPAPLTAFLSRINANDEVRRLVDIMLCSGQIQVLHDYRSTLTHIHPCSYSRGLVSSMFFELSNCT